ncbi:MAG: mRNA surveillance protein pelota [Thermoprotei archaeon]
MKILLIDNKKGIVELIPENDDDLWILYNIIKPGDIVVGTTTREVKISDKGSSKRIPMKLAVRVEKMEFQPFTDRLRITGIVIEGPDKYGVKGKHHTLSVIPGTRISIIKEKWLSYELEKLRKSSLTNYKVLLVALDYDEVCVAVLTEQGIKYIYEDSSRISGKSDPEAFAQQVSGYIKRVASTLTSLFAKEGVKIIIVASPGDLAKRVITETSIPQGIRVFIDSVSIGGCSGIRELIRRDSVRNAIRELSTIRALEILEVFKTLLARNHELVAYGVDDVEYAVRNNAVDKLVISSSLLRIYDEEFRKRIEKILEEGYKRRAEIVIVPEKTDVSIELENFGGIIAILRYPLPRLS